MDRTRLAPLAWAGAGALALASLPLVLFNAFHVETRGRNEELGAAFLVAASILLAGGAALRGWSARGSRAALAIAGAVPILTIGLVIAANVMLPDLPFTVRGWRASAEPGTTVDLSDLPPPVRDAFASGAPEGCVYFSEWEWRDFVEAYRRAGGAAAEPDVVSANGRTIRFGADVPCPIP